jgi:hypothetical protein
MNRSLAAVLVVVFAAAPLRGVLAQTGGVLSGVVRDSASGEPLRGATVTVTDLRREASADSTGRYRFRELRSGWHRVVFRMVGYRAVVRESVLVRAGLVTELDAALRPSSVELSPYVVTSRVDPVLDPLAPASTQRISATDLRSLPVSSVEEAVALSAGAVGESYRGGRLGQQSFVLDGLGVKNQLDASTGGLGIRIPPDMLTEASLVTNGFSARFGQALSGMVNVVTKDGGAEWSGRTAYESDRAFPDGWDYGLDRLLVQGDGPLFGGVRFVGAVDVSARFDADPVNAPPPADARDPRAARPGLLPHNRGEAADFTGKLTIPLGGANTLRLFGLRSMEQRLLFEPSLKYDDRYAPARSLAGSLFSAHWQLAPAASWGADLRVAWFDREFLRGQLVAPPRTTLGAFSGEIYHYVGESLARAQDTAAARAAVPGMSAPFLSDRTPWGVPAFFLEGGGRGDIAWNRFRELRTQLDVNISGGRFTDWYVGGEIVRQQVRTFQRVQGYDTVGTPLVVLGDTLAVPPATASSFSPVSGAAYVEAQARFAELAITLGVRYDRFNPRARAGGTVAGARGVFSPRFGISTVLSGATVVVSYGRFAQAPDFQYLVDAAFDDTLRTGRFRTGNPALGFETASQFEFSVRARPRPQASVRVNAFYKRLEGLVASVPIGLDPDSSVFGNADFGTVIGTELIVEREIHRGWGVRLAYTLQRAQATATNAFQLLRRIRVAGTGVDTLYPAAVEFPLDYDRRHGLTAVLQARVGERGGPRLGGVQPLRGLAAAAIVKWNSGLPFSRTNATGDTLLALPNSYRMPDQMTVDLLVRRPVTLFGVTGGVYLDMRNALNRRNIVAVRRDTGEPGPGETGIQAAALAAYNAHPEPIPYESPRYRAWADDDGNGEIAGAELMELFVAAARDFHQPLFAYGQPRLVRLGFEVVF